jgi:hypothetical protein
VRHPALNLHIACCRLTEPADGSLSSIPPTAVALPGGMRCHLAELAAGPGKLIVIETLARD